MTDVGGFFLDFEPIPGSSAVRGPRSPGLARGGRPGAANGPGTAPDDVDAGTMSCATETTNAALGPSGQTSAGSSAPTSAAPAPIVRLTWTTPRPNKFDLASSGPENFALESCVSGSDCTSTNLLGSKSVAGVATGRWRNHAVGFRRGAP